MSTLILPVITLLSLAAAQAQSNETVLGVYMFHRHGDRTAKSTPNTALTDLGYSQVYASGQYYRERYISSNASYQISGISHNLVNLNQISVSAGTGSVLQNSALGFVQGLYPAVGESLGSQTLRGGANATSPLNGYQLIPISVVGSTSDSEDSTWLQSTSGCANAITSSNEYYYSSQYESLLNSTQDLYQSILPVINGTFNSASDSYKNAYAIWDLINVAEIHNSTINSSDLITADVFNELYNLANVHEWGLAYNASDKIRAVQGATLAAQVVQFLNSTLTGKGKQTFGIQFGSYGQFSSFFGLADLPSVNSEFYTICDYASAMTFEMFTNSSTPVTSSSYPLANETYVRFLWHNGTTNSSSPPTIYPLFGSGQDVLSWDEFAAGMNSFAIGSTPQFCQACGNTTGTCAQYSNSSSSSGGSTSSSSSDSSSNSGNGLSPTVNGVIGAMVTLAVVLGIELLVLLLGGLRIVSKRRLVQDGPAVAVDGSNPMKA